jgi:sortase A
VNASLFETYENWVFDQRLAHAPSSYAGFLAQAISFGDAQPAPIRSSVGDNTTIARSLLFGNQSVLGRLEIPRIALKTMVLEGISPRTLALAVGHIPGTALPGRSGNVGIAGHRDTFFRELRNVRQGDEIVLTTMEGSWTYEVVSCEVVQSADTRVLEESDQPGMTLVTCYPFSYVGPAPERFVIHARRITG